MSIYQKLRDLNKPRFYVVGYYTQDKKAGERKGHHTPILSEQEKRAFIIGANSMDLGPYVAIEGTKEQVKQLLELQD